MRFSGRHRYLLLCFAGVAAVGCDKETTAPGPPGPEPPLPGFVHLQSDAGDYIGAGGTYDYTQANAVITVTAGAGHFGMSIRGDEWWFADFQIPSGINHLQPGNYTDLQRYPFHDPAKGGLSWYGEGRGCNTLSGSFSVDSVRYAQDTLLAIDLRFEQHCEGGSAALHGTIRWRLGDTTSVRGPVTPVPDGLWRPAPGATPATGNYTYLSSDTGDYIGLGGTFTYTTMTVTASGGHLGVSINGAQWWFGDFQAMNTLNKLQAGYYGGLRRYPFHNPVKGGLDWSGEGRGCNTLLGWFAVDRLTYAGDSLTAIDLRFEQRCEGGSSALHGKIHWGG